MLRLVERADALLEGFRPGVMERLGLGPDVCLARNPRLVYGRMTGWGQEGPLAPGGRPRHQLHRARRALLHTIGRAGEKPLPPLNLVGDFGGGGMLLAFGMVCALVERQRSGKGQVVDAAMVDGAAVLMTMMHAFRHAGMWQRRARHQPARHRRALLRHLRDEGRQATSRSARSSRSSTPSCSSGRGLEGEELPRQMDRAQWPAMKERLAAIFKTKTRDEWCEIMEGSDVCFAPVLDDGRGHRAPAQRRARHLRRDRGQAAAGARRRASAAPPPTIPTPPPAPRPAHRRGAARLGLQRRRPPHPPRIAKAIA